MKTHCKQLATALAALLAPPLLAAPRPLVWRADFPSAKVENFPVRHGTDVEFRPSWHVNGVPANTNGWTYSLSVQTNGAPAGEWSVIPGTVFSHTNDCGADAYNVLVRAVDRDGTVDYSAAARLRMLPSPGFEPGALPPAATFQESDPVFATWLSAFHESDPVFSSWLSTFEIPETSLEPATNYTARSISSFAATGTVARASSYGTPTRWTDATGCVWEVEHAPWTMTTPVGLMFEFAYSSNGVMRWASSPGNTLTYSPPGSWAALLLDGEGHFNAPFDATELIDGEFMLQRSGLYVTNLVGRVALTNDIPAETDPTVPDWAKEPSPPSYSAADVGAAPASIVPVLTTVSNAAETAKLNAETALRIVLGESVWFAVTNYMRTVEGVIPSLQLWEVRDSATNLVYDSREEITNTVRVLTSELRAELEARIPSKAWGNYQSDGTDNPQPGDVAIVNQPTVILTGGGTFNKYVEVGDSSVWVLQSSGPVSFGGNTNGNFFAVLDDEGNAHFRVAKTDSYDLPAFISDVLPRQSQNHILIYTATTNRHGNAVSEHPTLSVCSDLKDSLWYEEVEGEIDALGISVSWARDDTIPAWVATATPDTYPPHLFFRCKFKQEGGVAVINTAPVRFDGGIQLGNGTYRLVPYPSGGKTYLTVEGMP